MAGRWDSTTTIKFVRLYKSQVCLWDFKSPAYKSKKMRQAALAEIAEAMELPDFGIHDVKTKIKNLRSTYCQEVKKIENSKVSGSDDESVYEPNIKWFRELETIYKDTEDVRRGGRRPIDNVYYKKNENEEKPETILLESLDIPITQHTKTEDTTPNSRMSNIQPSSNQAKRMKISQPLETQNTDVIDNRNLNAEEDEYAVVGKRIAFQLKGMDERQRLIAERIVSEVMYYGRMGRLEENTGLHFPSQLL